MTTMLLPNPADLSTTWDDFGSRESGAHITTSSKFTNETIGARAKVYQAIIDTKSITIDLSGPQTSETPIRSRVFEDRQLKAVRNWLAHLTVASTALSGLSGVRFSVESFEYCLRKGSESELQITLDDLSASMDAIRECFSVIGSPFVNLVRDPEIDDVSFLVIEIQVRGSVKENVKAHREFARKAAKLLGVKRENLTLHYEII